MGCGSKLHCILTWSQFSEQSLVSALGGGSCRGHQGAEVVCGMGVGVGLFIPVENGWVAFSAVRTGVSELKDTFSTR